MSAREELARVLHGWGESHDWRSERCDEFCAAWLEAADAVLSEWLPRAVDDERAACFTRTYTLEMCRGASERHALRRALAAALSHSSPASDGPGETVPGAGEHDGHPEAPSPVSGGPSSGGAA